MKKKGRGREEAKKNIIKKSLSAAITAVLVSSVLIAFVPLAAADITSFTITPDTGTAGEVSAYRAFLVTNASGFTSLNITLPAGFGVEEPSPDELIARVDLWNNTQYYGYVTFTANNPESSNKLDVYANIGGDTASTTIDVDYSPGGTTNVGSPFGGASHATLTLPTDSTDGGLDVSLPMEMRHVLIDIEEFVKNPTTCGGYRFDITVNGYSGLDIVWITGVQAIDITSPESRTYASTCVRLNFTVEPEGTVLEWIGYNLDGGANVTIAGNTTVPVGAPPYDHSIVVYANDTCGNMVASNMVFFTIHPADIDFSGRVYVSDLLLLAQAYNSRPGDANWNPDADLNCDDRVYTADLLILAQNYDKSY